MSQAPPEFPTLEAFMNTRSFERDSDEFADPAGTATWLAEHGLLSGRGELDDADLARVVSLRETLRSAMRAHHDRTEDAAAVKTLDELAGDIPMRVSFGPDGASELEPAAGGVDEALGRILAIVHRAQLEGSWQRMKVCPADDCQWAFYDASKNRSGKWCSMAECGNRMKARAYRARSRA